MKCNYRFIESVKGRSVICVNERAHIYAMETPEVDDDGDTGQSCGGSCSFLVGLLEAKTMFLTVPSVHTFL